jgi:hypothetical protein
MVEINENVYKIARISEDTKQIPYVDNGLISEANDRPRTNKFILLLIIQTGYCLINLRIW